MSDPDEEFQLRWGRAASWARGQSFGPWDQGVAEKECLEIERIRDLIVSVGEDEAWEKCPELHPNWTGGTAA